MTAAHGDLAALIDRLPEERLRHVFTHASWAEDRRDSYERLGTRLAEGVAAEPR